MSLHLVLGGSLGGYHIVCVQPCHFRFSVASKAVGFLVRALKWVTTTHFDVYFHLWSDGGANWRKELGAWEEEEANQWTLISRKKRHASKKVQFSSPIKQATPPKLHQPRLSSVWIGDFSCQIPSYHDSPPPASELLVR
jgi:hypothetical protein